MAKKKTNGKYQNVFDFLTGWQNFLDQTFFRYTGKSAGDWMKEFVQRPKELPQGEGVMLEEPGMSLADAYAILGCERGDPLTKVKKYYRNLAKAFHSDSGTAMNDEAMKALNRAYDRITREGSNDTKA